jgi:superfamily II DNA or RNA helicase
MQWRQKTFADKKKGRAQRRIERHQRATAPPAPEPVSPPEPAPEQPRARTRPVPAPRPEPAPSAEPTPTRPARQRPARPTQSKKGKKGKGKKEKLSRLNKPDGMSLEDWQRELRRQFGREQNFTLKNLGSQPIFSEFEVTNPQSKRTYRVHVRGRNPGDNHCSCPDFATNTLGTCKHIEFTLSKLERRRGGRAELKAGYQPPYSEIFLQYGAQREVRFRPGSAASTKLARLAAGYFGPDGALMPEGFGHFETFLAEVGKLDDEVRYLDDVLSFVAEVRDVEQRARRVGEAFTRGAHSAAFKNLLKVPMYEYQREGALFAARTGRCLLGDDMGLGKTIQALGAAEIMARLFGVERVLVVCPTSLKHQWQREIERFTKRESVVISGLRARRARGFDAAGFFKIMNYDTVHTDLDLIERWAPDLVILDEAQRIKNWNTRTARSVKQISSPYALVLTGTPLENRLEELISIVQFIDQYRLGPTFRLLHEHQLRDEVGKVIGYKNLDRIGRTLSPILLRRHKDEVLDQLPDRIDSNFFVPMTDQQRKHHDENLEIVARIVQKWRTYRFLSEADQRRLMIALQYMRMSCDSSFLVDHVTDHGVKADEAMTVLEELFEQPGTKAVVFSQWVRMHELVARRLKAKGIGHVLFQGSVPSNKRKDLIDRFRDDPECRVFLSTDAGGTGLNLQHASLVINMDLPWNPAVLEQRIGRVHRLGQKNPVRVVNFIAQGTIEEGMLEVIRFKKSVFAGVLDGGEKDVFLGGSRLNKFMEQVERVSSAIPEVTIEDADAAYGASREPEGGPGDGRGGFPAEVNGHAGGRPGKGKRGRGRPAPPPPMPEEEPAPPPAPPTGDPWSGLLQAGMALLQQVVGASQASHGGERSRPTGDGARGSAPTNPLLGRDERTGETYLKLPVPPPDMLEQLIKGVGSLLEGFRK